MINRFDSTNTTTKTRKAKNPRDRRATISLDVSPTPKVGIDRRAKVESTVTAIKPGYLQRQIPNGAFEIEPCGTILHFRPYDANGISIDELEGLNLFEDVIRTSSDRDATYFTACFERGETFKTSRHLLHGRDLSLILLYHASSDTYWGFLGPA